MSPSSPQFVRTAVITATAALVAMTMGWQVAEESYLLPSLLAATAAVFVLAGLHAAPVVASLLGVLLFGYLAGNRGFAQLVPIPQLPLLPAEIVLIAGNSWLVFQGIRSGRHPFIRDRLNAGIIVWILVGFARIGIDVRAHGLIAMRDFAIVYYASFFFLAQCLAENRAARSVLLKILLAGCIVQPLAAASSEAFPELFLDKLTVRGTPLIFFKGDLALTFNAVSSMMLALAAPRSWRRWTWPAATVGVLLVLGGGNRASLLAALTALAWLLFSRARLLAILQIAAAIGAFVSLLILAQLAGSRDAERTLQATRERLTSITDVFGGRSYEEPEGIMKSDNNRFRSAWWQEVTRETIERDPWLGLGFGHDLAQRFLRTYYPDGADDFSARSPHNIMVTLFGRMGLAGLLPFLFICLAFAMRLAQTVASADADTAPLALWLSAWIVLVSACFGVVLEGPMGAVLFWSLLGIANQLGRAPREQSAPYPA